jgi:pyruvate/2-oxoacid:ferredoxin oxidoreductase alpha subunit
MPGGAANGPLFNEIASVTLRSGLNIQLENYILGLGGRDVVPEQFQQIFEELNAPKQKEQKKEMNYHVIGVRA